MGWHHIASHSRLARLKTQMYFTNSQVMVVVRVFAHTDKPIGLLFVWQAQIDKITNYKSELFHRKKFIPCAETHKNILCEGNINSGTKTISENERRERERERRPRAVKERSSTFWEIVKCVGVSNYELWYCALSFRHYNNHVCDDVSWKLWALAFRFGFSYIRIPFTIAITTQFGPIQLILFWFFGSRARIHIHLHTHPHSRTRSFSTLRPLSHCDLFCYATVYIRFFFSPFGIQLFLSFS